MSAWDEVWVESCTASKMLSITPETNSLLSVVTAVTRCVLWFNTRITYYSTGQMVQLAFLLWREFSLLTALSIKYTSRSLVLGPHRHTLHGGWEGKGETGAENTEMAPFLLESGLPYPRDHSPGSFLHANELFSYLREEEKLHRRGRPILGHTITAICIPPVAGLAQECALQLCGGKGSLGRKEWGGGVSLVCPSEAL